MKKILFALLLMLAPALGWAQNLIARQGDDWVRLYDRPCESELVIGRLAPGAAETYRAAVAGFQGQTFQACWRMVGDSAHLVYEDGDQGLIPKGELKREEII